MIVKPEQVLDKPHLLGHALGYTDLTPLHDEWIKYIWFTDKDRYLEAHRGSYKTTAILILGNIIFHLFFPDLTTLIVRKEYTDHVKPAIKQIGDQLKSDVIKIIVKEWYDCDFYLVKDTESEISSNLKQSVTNEENIKGCSIGKVVTGSHYNRVVTDDIETMDDRVSKAAREKSKLVYQELSNVVNPGCPLSSIGTPWHKDGVSSIMPKPKKYPIGSTGLKKFTDEHIKKLKKKMTTALYSINYNLEYMVDSEAYFKEPNYGDWPEACEPIAHIDKKYAGKDTGALTYAAEYNGNIYMRGIHFTEHIEDYYDSVVKFQEIMKGGTLHNEDNDDKGLASSAMRERGVIVSTYHEATNKHVKITTFLKANWDRIIWDYRTDPEYMVQIIDYREGEGPDDAPDSAASILRILMGNPSIDDLIDYYS